MYLSYFETLNCFTVYNITDNSNFWRFFKNVPAQGSNIFELKYFGNNFRTYKSLFRAIFFAFKRQALYIFRKFRTSWIYEWNIELIAFSDLYGSHCTSAIIINDDPKGQGHLFHFLFWRYQRRYHITTTFLLIYSEIHI